MRLQFSKSPIQFLNVVAQEVVHGEVTQEVRLSDGMPDIGRILTTWGQVVLRSKQWQGRTIGMSGGVMLWTLYMPEDGSDPRTIESWVPFQLNLDGVDAAQEGPVRVLPMLRFADSRSLSARKILVRAGVSGMIQAFSPDDTFVYTPGELPEDIQLLKKKYPLRIPSECGEKTFMIDEELQISGSEDAPEKLLSISVTPVVSDRVVHPDKIILRGELEIHLVTRTAEGKIVNGDRTLDFSQLIELEQGYDQGASADFILAVTNLETDTQSEGKIRIKCSLVAQYLVDVCRLVETVEDAYSPMREVKLEKSELELPVILEDRTEVLLPEAMLPARNGEVVDGVFHLDFPRKRQNGNGLDLELTGLFQSLIMDEQETLQAANSRWEGTLRMDAGENTFQAVSMMNVSPVRSIHNQDGVKLSANVQMQIRTGAKEYFSMVTELEVGAVREADPARPSLIITALGQNSLWEVAKQCGSTVDAICAANGIGEQEESDQLLLIPVI